MDEAAGARPHHELRFPAATAACHLPHDRNQQVASIITRCRPHRDLRIPALHGAGQGESVHFAHPAQGLADLLVRLYLLRREGSRLGRVQVRVCKRGQPAGALALRSSVRLAWAACIRIRSRSRCCRRTTAPQIDSALTCCEMPSQRGMTRSHSETRAMMGAGPVRGTADSGPRPAGKRRRARVCTGRGRGGSV